MPPCRRVDDDALLLARILLAASNQGNDLAWLCASCAPVNRRFHRVVRHVILPQRLSCLNLASRSAYGRRRATPQAADERRGRYGKSGRALVDDHDNNNNKGSNDGDAGDDNDDARGGLGDRSRRAVRVAHALQRLFDDCAGAGTERHAVESINARGMHQLMRDDVVKHITALPAHVRSLDVSHCGALSDIGVISLLLTMSARNARCEHHANALVAAEAASSSSSSSSPVFATDLRALYFASCRLTSRAVREIAVRCPMLERLDLSFSLADDAGVCALGGEALPGLRWLRLRGCEHVTDAGVRALWQVEQLDVAFCPEVSDASLLALAGLHQTPAANGHADDDNDGDDDDDVLPPSTRQRRRGRPRPAPRLRRLTLASHEQANVWGTGLWSPGGRDALVQAGVTVHLIDA